MWAIERIKVDLGVMSLKECSQIYKDPELEPHHLMQSSVIPWTIFSGGILPLSKGYWQLILSSGNGVADSS